MWTITRLENLSGVYVKRYWFSIFVVVDRCLLYSKTSRQIGAVEALLPSVNIPPIISVIQITISLHV